MIPENVGLNISMENNCAKCCPRKFVLNCCCCRTEEVEPHECDHRVNNVAVPKEKPKHGVLRRWLTQ